MAVSRSIGFLRQFRRQNMVTSRARNCFYVVGHHNLIFGYGAEAWTGWWNSLNVHPANRNQNLRITFRGPVKWFVDGNQVNLPSDGPLANVDRTPPGANPPQPRSIASQKPLEIRVLPRVRVVTNPVETLRIRVPYRHTCAVKVSLELSN